MLALSNLYHAVTRLPGQSDRGTITVVQAGDTFSVAARHELGEPVLASPALAGNILLIRGKEHLWAFAN